LTEQQQFLLYRKIKISEFIKTIGPSSGTSLLIIYIFNTTDTIAIKRISSQIRDQDNNMGFFWKSEAAVPLYPTGISTAML